MARQLITAHRDWVGIGPPEEQAEYLALTDDVLRQLRRLEAEHSYPEVSLKDDRLA